MGKHRTRFLAAHVSATQRYCTDSGRFRAATADAMCPHSRPGEDSKIAGSGWEVEKVRERERTLVSMQVRLFATAVLLTFTSAASAWDASGHRTIARLALEGLPSNGPGWVREPGVIERITDEAVVPDRWRSTKLSQLQHDNNPDHYIDIEDLEPYDISFAKIPPLRLEFVKQLMEIRARKGWTSSPKAVNPARDLDKTQEWPGFLPYSIMDQYGKVQSAFRVIRVLEKLNEPARLPQLEQARYDASVNMGLLAHYVGDAAQPLHTTKHHHGWVGENPGGYSTDRGFHSYIDGGVIRLHSIGAGDVRAMCKFNVKIDAADPWNDVLVYIQRSFDQVEPLYKLEKSGELKKPAGKVFIEKRLADAATMLEAMYESAWTAAEPKQADIDEFVKYDGFGK